MGLIPSTVENKLTASIFIFFRKKIGKSPNLDKFKGISILLWYT
jgi:hypothetical protein